MRKAFVFGKADNAAVAKILMASANLSVTNATAYAAPWNGLYAVSMEPADIASLRREFEVLKAVGAVKGSLPDTALVPGPYEQSKAIQ